MSGFRISAFIPQLAIDKLKKKILTSEVIYLEYLKEPILTTCGDVVEVQFIHFSYKEFLYFLNMQQYRQDC